MDQIILHRRDNRFFVEIDGEEFPVILEIAGGAAAAIPLILAFAPLVPSLVESAGVIYKQLVAFAQSLRSSSEVPADIKDQLTVALANLNATDVQVAAVKV